ncbi:glycosyltransferase [uncultured Corynebacterium sp.]|uniref:galactofuranosyltransferase GlfT1 n=1 Tax=uncultured Corynebacterium sp. TaxID=159447 RepID=UPI0025DA7643|nr:glycosyltransferase family 2 protein [uncultured Corynebacterium sp.]
MNEGPNSSTAVVVVTHNRLRELTGSLDILVGQTHAPEWVIVVDNGDDPRVRDAVEALNDRPDRPEAGPRAIYLGSKTNLGGAGGFAYGMLHALSLGADWIWCADDDGRPEDTTVLATLHDCAARHGLDEVSPVVCNIDDPDKLAFPLRRGLTWRRNRSELIADDDAAPGDPGHDLLPGIASLFNGALFSAASLERLGVPDYRLFIRGDEVEFHRRLARSGLRFGTCLTTAYLHPSGTEEFHPILGGRMHTQYPADDFKRYFTYRNRGYLMSQPGMRKLLPQEYARFAWFFLVQRRDVPGFLRWWGLHRRGRRENFERFDPKK